ncbi:MAG TPA: bifunctional UDP-sugar hydrolase/5'-nucleotidase [Bacteroidales bacterium]|nr:bifunctional UDP-sugar hydrolase/5'-nucleotidase [Bacteroidales bacterium]
MIANKVFYKMVIVSIITLSILNSCENRNKQDSETELKIFFINDNHAQIDNFSKIKYIIDEAEEEGKVILVSSGDMFSGNPLVDFYEEKGFPVIDLMNRTGFDLATLGNHEFDYGQEVLQDRIDQASFDVLCANMTSQSPLLDQPEATAIITAGDLEVQFVGVVETNGKPGAVIPSTHPSKLENLVFTDAAQTLGNYSTLKEDSGADLLILLSHLGHNYGEGATSDYSVAGDYPFFDMIIGGHSHSIQDTTINGVHIYQAGSYLNYLGKISLDIKDEKIISEEFELIKLDDYDNYSGEIADLVESYNTNPDFEEVLGTNNTFLTRNRTVGCFYTDAIRGYLQTDISFQNPGGIRADIDEGDITLLEIYNVDPFGNRLLKYEMTVSDIKDFLEGTGTGLYYSGVVIESDPGTGVIIKDQQGNILESDRVLSVAINDYIPNIHESYFPEPAEVYDITTAEAIISYLRNLSEPIDYPKCNRYFRYEE